MVALHQYGHWNYVNFSDVDIKGFTAKNSGDKWVSSLGSHSISAGHAILPVPNQTIEVFGSNYDVYELVEIDDIYEISSNIISERTQPIASGVPIVSSDLVPEDVEQGYIAPQEESLAVGYPLWHQNAISVPKDDGSVDVFFISWPSHDNATQCCIHFDE